MKKSELISVLAKHADVSKTEAAAHFNRVLLRYCGVPPVYRQTAAYRRHRAPL